MAKIKLNSHKYKNLYAIVDEDNFKYLNEHRWFVHKESGRKNQDRFVAETTINKKNIKMHRLITNCPQDKVVDHINGNPLDNRKENLRICSIAENTRNSLVKAGKSICKGVDWNARISRWRVRICINGKRITFGHYKSEIEAAKVYNEAAEQYFGEFAKLNEILNE